MLLGFQQSLYILYGLANDGLCDAQGVGSQFLRFFFSEALPLAIFECSSARILTLSSTETKESRASCCCVEIGRFHVRRRYAVSVDYGDAVCNRGLDWLVAGDGGGVVKEVLGLRFGFEREGV